MRHFFSINSYTVPESNDPTTQSYLTTEFEYVIYRRDTHGSHIEEIERGERVYVKSYAKKMGRKLCRELDENIPHYD